MRRTPGGEEESARVALSIPPRFFFVLCANDGSFSHRQPEMSTPGENCLHDERLFFFIDLILDGKEIKLRELFFFHAQIEMLYINHHVSMSNINFTYSAILRLLVSLSF